MGEWFEPQMCNRVYKRAVKSRSLELDQNVTKTWARVLMSTFADLSVVIDTTLFLQNLLLGDIPPEYDKVSPYFEPVDSSKTC